MEDFSKKLFNVTQDEQKATKGGKALIAIQMESVDKSKERIDRIKDLFIDGIIDRPEFEKRKKVEEMKIQAASKELDRLSQSNDFVDEVKRKERMKFWKEIDRNKLFEEGLSVKEKNEGFKKLIERIEYKLEGDIIEINVIYK